MKPGRNPKESAGGGRVLRWAVAVGLTLAAVAGVVWGVARIGDLARSRVGPRDRYAVRFADLACDVPPGLTRDTFLAEVRYVSNAPETVQALDPELPRTLGAAFAAHPWVAAFDGVTVSPEGEVRVRLRFRTPGLAVETADGRVRVVDVGGVLLPTGTAADGLPVLVGPVAVPGSPAGRAWEDPAVRRAVRLAEAHRLRRIERTAGGWRLTTADGKTLTVGE
ncbi:MAG: hypothetical protein C0501_20870 [Isosphaera sp.]|nr:hypothetical protein [Isosphaera sp.]